MLQVIRLVTPGKVDKMIAFNELPKRFLVGVRKRDESATRPLREFLKQNKCIDRKINKFTDTDSKEVSNVEYEFPFTYYLEFQMVNADKDKWGEIVSYVRRVVDPTVRLMDKIEDMAAPCAPDSYSEFTLEAQDIPVILIPKELIKPSVSEKVLESPVVEKAEEEADSVKVDELMKRRGRPKKVSVEA